MSDDQSGSDADAGLIGTIISGRYQITAHLGSGGMGSVFQARQLAMDRLVALKLLHAHYATNKQAVARFNREMQVTAKIEHPNTIRVYDFGQTEDGRLYLAMEFLEGHTLSKALAGGEPMASERLVHIGVQIGKALAAAHSDGVVHRDLKPDNVMLLDRYGERDFVKVLDFGIARFMDDSAKTQLTAEGAVVGTPIYMSPEQATGGVMDHRTDIYSFGVMLFEMATGRVPFDAPTTISLMVKHVQEPPPRPSDFAPGLVPDAIETLVLQMLAKNPAARPTSALEVVRALEAAIAPSGPLAADTWVHDGYGDTHEAGTVPAPKATGTRPNATGAPGPHEPPTRTDRPDATAGPVPAPRSRRGLLFGVVGLIVAGGAAAAIALASGAPGPITPSDADAGALTDNGPDAGAHGATAPPESSDATSVADASPDADTGTEADTALGLIAPDATDLPDANADTAAEPDTAPAPDTAPPTPGSERRAELDKALVSMGYSVPPEPCRSSDATVEGAFIEAMALLEGGKVSSARDSDAHALAVLDKVADAARGTAEYWVLVAQARLYGGGKASTVLDAAARAVALCNNWAAAHNAVGNAHMRLDESQLALAAYQKAADLDPAYAAPRFNIGLIKLKQNDQDGAIAAFTEVIGRSPDHPNARLLRGQAYLHQKQYDRAIVDFKAETDRDSTNARAWLLLGQTEQKNGDDAAAHVAYCKAKELGAEGAKALCPDEP